MWRTYRKITEAVQVQAASEQTLSKFSLANETEQHVYRKCVIDMAQQHPGLLHVVTIKYRTVLQEDSRSVA